MIHTSTFPTLPAVTNHFNAPANAALRLVSVLPPVEAGQSYTAIYEMPPDPDAALEEERQRLLEEKILALIGMDDDKKRGANFPKAAILDGLSVPLSIVSNRLGQVAAFRALDNATRARWVRENAPAVGCAYISAEEARAHHGCAAELVRLLDE